MTQAGGDVKEEVWRGCIVLLTNTPELHGYAARALFRALRERLPDAQLSLVATATWYIGARPFLRCMRMFDCVLLAQEATVANVK